MSCSASVGMKVSGRFAKAMIPRILIPVRIVALLFVACTQRGVAQSDTTAKHRTGAPTNEIANWLVASSSEEIS